MNKVTERFFEAIEMAGLTPYRICKDIPSIPQSRISNARKGANEIGIDTVSAVCEYYRNINGNYILTGRETPIMEEKEAADNSNYNPEIPNEVNVIKERIDKFMNGKSGQEREQAASTLMSFFEATIKMVEMFSVK